MKGLKAFGTCIFLALVCGKVQAANDDLKILRKLWESTPTLKASREVKPDFLDAQQNPSPPAKKIDTASRCLYGHQTYVLGEMLKTADGWFRCTPTFFYEETSPLGLQSGHSAWVRVEG